MAPAREAIRSPCVLACHQGGQVCGVSNEVAAYRARDPEPHGGTMNHDDKVQPTVRNAIFSDKPDP
jgi:hypothetical protein